MKSPLREAQMTKLGPEDDLAPEPKFDLEYMCTCPGFDCSCNGRNPKTIFSPKTTFGSKDEMRPEG